MVFFTAPASALRCGGDLVSEGDRKTEVIKKCGEPDDIETWQVERSISVPYYYRDKRDRLDKTYHRRHRAKELITVEEWTYNFGPYRFIRYLTFEKGRLEEIEIGRRGY
jgi:hypothetical protein